MSESIIKGRVAGTGAAIAITLGWSPARVEILIPESSAFGFWDDSMRNGTFCVESVGELRAGDVLIGRHLPAIGTTDTQLRNYRCVGFFNGTTPGIGVEITAVAAGTAFTATTHDVTTGSKWGIFKLSCQAGGTKILTPAAAYNYATEAAAIAALAATPANEVCLGYVTIQSTAGAKWDATTDALAGGSSGVAAAATNYYEGYGVMSNGITPKGLVAGDTYRGFQIGTDALLNVAGSQIDYKAYRS